MTFTKKICAKTRALAYLMVVVEGRSYRETAKMLNVSISSVHRCCKEESRMEGGNACGSKPETRGRPRVISHREEARFMRTFRKMRMEGKNPTVKEVMTATPTSKGSYPTYVRILNKAGYKKLQPRKKGLLSSKDKCKRKAFARKALKERDDTFWTHDVAFYLDAVSFVHKYNPFREASKPKGRVYRKPSEGLTYTTTGSKDLPGGRRVHVVVAISYNRGVVLAEPYEKMSGNFFVTFIRNKLPHAFADAEVTSRRSRLAKMFVMDNDPCQNSKAAREALQEIGGTVVNIPARLPALNPIENVFHNVKRTLYKQAMERRITKESYEEFSCRIMETMFSFDGELIKGTIATMPKRLKCIVASDGNRTRY